MSAHGAGRRRGPLPVTTTRTVLVAPPTVLLAVVLLATLCDITFARGAREERPLWGSGTIEGTSIIVSAEIGGTVRIVHTGEGEHRQSGDPLITLDSRDLELHHAIRRAEAGIADAERRLVEGGARAEDIRQAEARVRRLQSDQEAAREDYQRMARLLEAESITRSRYEEAELRLTRTETELVAAEQDLERVRNLARPEEREIARLRAERAEYGRRLAEQQLDKVVIRAPRSAWVDRLLLEEGEYVLPGRPAVRLLARDPVRLTVFISQRDISEVAVGDMAEVLVDAYPERRFSGRVIRIAEEAEFTPANVQTREERARLVFAVQVEIPNPELLLRPGMSAEAEFPGARGDENG